VTTIVSLVHASYIITRGGIPVIISALVEDCMSLTVANLPVVATASYRRLSGVNPRDANPDGDGQRWSSFKFRTRSNLPGSTTRWSTGIGVSRGAVTVDTTELTGTTFGQTKATIPAYAIGSKGSFSGTKTEGEAAEKSQAFGQVRREDRGVVRIDVLPYPHEQPASES